MVRQKYYREVLAYACYYLDLYLEKSEKVELERLQIVALSALLLATKIDGASFPKLGNNFNIEDILETEVKICLKLNYFLIPKTYVHVLNDLLEHWESFTESRVDSKEEKYLEQSLGAFNRHRSLYEKA